MSLRVLLVESHAEETLFFEDVLTEIEAGRYWNPWVHIETLHAPTWSDAAAILMNEPVDVLLLSLDLADSHGADTFRRAQAAAPQIPVVLLVGPQDDALGVRLIRDGAQDFLVKGAVDCAPLAHAIRCAVERHRLLTAARAHALHDSLTGLPNRSGFFLAGERDRKLAQRLGRRWMVMIAEPRNLAELASAYGEQRRDLALVEAADHLRSIMGPTDLVARIGATRFGLAIFDTEVESVEEVWARLHGAAAEHRMLIGAAVFDLARPASLETLLEQAALDLAPMTLVMRR